MTTLRGCGAGIDCADYSGNPVLKGCHLQTLRKLAGRHGRAYRLGLGFCDTQ
jgi:hypothetical protein